MSHHKMTAHEPIKYLDSILNEEEKRCEYSHEWRNYTISRSGRFKSKNRKRDTVDRKLFDATENPNDNEKLTTASTTTTINSRQTLPATTKDCKIFQTAQATKSDGVRERDKTTNYKNYYETNL